MSRLKAPLDCPMPNPAGRHPIERAESNGRPWSENHKPAPMTAPPDRGNDNRSGMHKPAPSAEPDPERDVYCFARIYTLAEFRESLSRAGLAVVLDRRVAKGGKP